MRVCMYVCTHTHTRTHTHTSHTHHTKADKELLQAEMLSGNVTIETNFFDGQRLLAKSLIRVYYD